MDRNQAKEFYHILQAYAEGKVIECRTKPSFIEGTDVPNEWTEMKEIEFWNNTEYRIKPEPKYRPFKDAEECLKEMSTHTPFGWLKEIKRDTWTQISYVHNEGIETVNSGSASYKSLFDCFTFFDGKPFGIKVE